MFLNVSVSNRYSTKQQRANRKHVHVYIESFEQTSRIVKIIISAINYCNSFNRFKLVSVRVYT